MYLPLRAYVCGIGPGCPTEFYVYRRLLPQLLSTPLTSCFELVLNRNKKIIEFFQAQSVIKENPEKKRKKETPSLQPR